MKPNNDLTQGPVTSHLFRMTVPMIFAMLSMVLFNLVDTFFVARLGTVELAAMGFTLPVVMFITGIALGLGVATASVVSRAIGVGDINQVRRLTTHSLMISLFSVIVFSALGLLTLDPVFKALGATPEILPFIKRYMVTWYIGAVFVVIPMVGNNAIRACGDTFYPGLIMVISTLINIVLDPLLIFGWGWFPRLTLQGAALATVIARASSFVFSILILYFREKLIILALPKWSQLIDSAKRILYIAVPSSFANILLPLGMAVITRLVAGFGPRAVAALGAAMRIEMFVFILVMALSTALVPFIGQNWGAGKLDRVKTSVILTNKFSLLWGVCNFVLILVLAEFLGNTFSQDILVSVTITHYLLIRSLGYGLRSIAMITSSVFDAVNKPFYSSSLSITRVFVLSVPFAYLGSVFGGLIGIFAGLLFADIVAGIISIVVGSKRLLI